MLALHDEEAKGKARRRNRNRPAAEHCNERGDDRNQSTPDSSEDTHQAGEFQQRPGSQEFVAG
jgi:hypothetical protein